MATSAITPTNDFAANAASQLRLDDLLKVLLTELTHQDPFKPVENTDFMAQIAQFASLSSTQQLNTNIEQLVALQAMNQSVALIGRRVSAKVNGATVDGVVKSLSLADGLPRITINTDGGEVIPNVAIGQLETVR